MYLFWFVIFNDFNVKMQSLDLKMFTFLMLFDDAEGFIAGGTAGVVVETALYPIDTIKTRLQARQTKFISSFGLSLTVCKKEKVEL